ncbi:hypothetical protein NKR23_g7879 [Pleurostoma richardsiae]|uniref:Glyoxalase/fosfomycin resistance/dioxygenase domain-containing protein n=1 Tax=Pleurostoma richardsiae TaxID=41990 RepID=A0AA38RS95_9PEZI|nr:hypothetical protein NKR23_g7879 [Pleurostoma richardsiae]
MAIDHSGIRTDPAQHASLVAWYEAALRPLGYVKLLTYGPNGEAVGFSDTGSSTDWWLTCNPEKPNVITHHAFTARGMTTVDAFHVAAVAAGGKDNGPPGIRMYHPSYYAAFVLDPAGNNIEVVCHAPVTDSR